MILILIRISKTFGFGMSIKLIQCCRLCAEKFILLILFCGSASLCAEPQALMITATLESFQLTLVNDNKDCQLSVASVDSALVSIVLPNQSPCYFFQDHLKQQAQHYTYPKAKGVKVLLMAGTAVKASREQRQAKKLSLDAYCTQTIQALILEEGVIKLGVVDRNALACADDRLDEIRYRQVLKQPRQALDTFPKAPITVLQPPVVPLERLSLIEVIQKKIQALFD